jgi:hypothetical protein
MKYHRRTTEVKPQLHWGQRKLLLSEIEFLTLFTKPDDEVKQWLVVYAGAADGKHDIYLSELFPQCEFHLYDPAKFDSALVKYSETHDNIKIFNEYFTDEVCEKYKGKNNVLFISDIRSVPEGYNTRVSEVKKATKQGIEIKKVDDSEKFDEEVVNNMAWQKKWVEIIQPRAYMLKFRLPYPGNTIVKEIETEYLDGDIYFQVWAGNTSTEGRLIGTTPIKYKKYDHGDYEEKMFHFNVVERASKYNVDESVDIPSAIITGIEGEKIVHEFNDYDVMAEQHILNEYIKKFKYKKSLREMINDIDDNLGTTLTGKYKWAKRDEVESIKGLKKILDK